MAWGNKQINIILVVFALLILSIMALNYKPSLSWKPTWAQADKNPLGGKGLHELWPKMNPGSKIKTTYEPINLAPLENNPNLLLLCTNLNMDQAQWDSLHHYLAQGHTALIAAHYLPYPLRDSLNINLNLNGQRVRDIDQILHQKDLINWLPPSYPASIPVHGALGKYTFVEKDSTQKSPAFESLARQSTGLDVVRRYPVGKGALILSSIPQALGNYYLMDTLSSGVGSGLLSLLPANKPLLHLEYYQVGRQISQTPLRYLLKQAPLRFALYTTLLGLAIFMIFGGKRRQRIIPPWPEPKNRSLDFVQTLGELYFHNRKGHRGLVEKRRRYFYEYVQKHFGISPALTHEVYLDTLARKSGQKRDKLKSVLYFLNKNNLSDEALQQMEHQLYQFYNYKK